MSRFASLTAGLLARKGEAEPASTPFADQLLTRIGAHGPDLRNALANSGYGVVTKPAFGSASFQDGVGAGRSAFGRHGLPENAGEKDFVPVMPPQPDPLHDEEVVETQCQPCASNGGEDPSKTFHVNLRLKRPRFVKLKLSAALLRRPAQDIVSEALDQWFEKLPPDVLGDCACMKSSGD